MANLHLSLNNVEDGDLHYVDGYAVTNTGAAACQLSGYPSAVTGFSDQHPVVQLDIIDSVADFAGQNLTDTPVQILPGSSAGLFLYYINDPNNPPCYRSNQGLLVTLPGTSGPLTITDTEMPACPGAQIYVSPIQPSPDYVEGS